MPRSRSTKSANPEFEQLVLAACLAQKLVSGGYDRESYAKAVASDLQFWKEITATAGNLLRPGESKRRGKR